MKTRLSRFVCLVLLMLLVMAAGAPLRAHPILKGVAALDTTHLEDLAALNAPYSFVWGQSCGRRANCTNMVREWQLPKTCYPELLVGNEPTNGEPAGHPVSTRYAVTSTLAIAAMCPDTRLIVANIHINNRDGVIDKAWLAQFLRVYKALAGREYGSAPHASGLSDVVGVHCYSLDAAVCVKRLSDVFALADYHGAYWLTEFNIYRGPNQFGAFLAWMGGQPRVERVYAFTNRGFHPFIDLVKPDGTLSPSGAVYRDWTGQ